MLPPVGIVMAEHGSVRVFPVDKPGSADKAVTIYDVAKAAGVSPSTVSRAFSRPGRVSARTAAHIHEVAAELGYRVPQVVKTEAARQSKMLGISATDITNPFFFGIIRGAEHVALAEDYSIILADSQENDELERRLSDRTMPLVDGMIVATSRLPDSFLRNAAKTAPVVSLNRLVPGLPSVITDNARGMRRALEHLAELGHRRVGPTAPTVRGGMGILPQIREQHVTAVICFNDVVAVGVMRAAKMAGVQVPHELSVVGIDNVFVADLVSPGLTTIASPLTLLGERAARTVIALANGQEPETSADRPSVLPMRLIVRESTGPAPRR